MASFCLSVHWQSCSHRHYCNSSWYIIHGTLHSFIGRITITNPEMQCAVMASYLPCPLLSCRVTVGRRFPARVYTASIKCTEANMYHFFAQMFKKLVCLFHSSCLSTASWLVMPSVILEVTWPGLVSGGL